MAEEQTSVEVGKGRPPEEKRMPHARWELVVVEFTTAHFDKVIPHALHPVDPNMVKFEVMDRNAPGSLYRGVKAPQSDYIVLRSTVVGQFHIRLYIPAHFDEDRLKTTSYVPPNTPDISGTPTVNQVATWVDANTLQGVTSLSKAQQHAQTAYLDAGNVFSAAANEFAELLKVDKGLTFPATQVASSGANDLDDYEEGSWTPVIGGATSESGQTYTNQIGRYVKIGKSVIAWFTVTLSAAGTITGNASLKGLPFVIINLSGVRPVTLIKHISTATNWIVIALVPFEGSSYGQLQGVSASGTSPFTNLTAADIGNTTAFNGIFIYQTDD